MSGIPDVAKQWHTKPVGAKVCDTCQCDNVRLRLVARHDEPPVLAESEKSAINALDPALTPLCVSFIGMQEAPSRAFGLYNVEEDIDNNLILHSTVSLQTIAAYGYRPVVV